MTNSKYMLTLAFTLTSIVAWSQSIITIREICVEDCANGGIDDDNDGDADCSDSDCAPIIDNVTIMGDHCINGGGSVEISPYNTDYDYILTDAEGEEIISTLPIFVQLETGVYTLKAQNRLTGCESIYNQDIDIISVCEVCTSGIDDDSDGSIDCEDTDCQPTIVDIDVAPEVCDDSSGRITAQAQGDNLLFILNGGTPQSSPIFEGLSSGAYTVEVVNSVTGCAKSYPYDVLVENTCEILANGIDDDGDGDIDCEDSQHYAVIRVLDQVRSSCDADDGWIRVEADGENLSYDLTGTYELIKDQVQSIDMSNASGLFEGLPPGAYTLTVTNGVSGCTSVRDISIHRLCEICDNDLDDDGDGYADCDDTDCMLAAIGLNAKGEKIEKSDPEDVCNILTEDEIEEIRSLRESNLLNHSIFEVEDLMAGCIDPTNQSHYFMTPNGLLLDINTVSQVGFISPSSPHYERLKYFVTTIQTNDGEYYQALIDSHGDFRGYYRYDVSSGDFVKPLISNRLSDFFLIHPNDDDYGNATVALDVGDDCSIEYFCLHQWREFSLNQATIGKDEVISYFNDARDYTRHAVKACDDDKINDILIFSNGFRMEFDVALLGLLASLEAPMNNLDAIARGISFKSQTEAGSVWYHDPFNYWNILPGKMKERLKPSTTLYVDGHDHINTSNHMDERRFALSLLSWALYSLPNPPTNTAPIVNDNSADGMPGFVTRRQKGKVAGARIANMIQSGEIEVDHNQDGRIIQKIDIVAHSMGYAYALGVMDGIKESGLDIGFDRFYILAAENACSEHGAFNLSDFGEVWQYGSRRGAAGGNDDPFIEQDGVAPQCAIQDLPEARRAYIPPQNEVKFNKNFLNSHSEGNYGWIFTNLRDENFSGYVTPK